MSSAVKHPGSGLSPPFIIIGKSPRSAILAEVCYNEDMKAHKKLTASKTMTLRLDAATQRRLDQLAEVTERSKAWLAAQAVKDYLELNEWQIQAINAAVKRANAPGAKFIDNEKVDAWLTSWGTPEEREPPL
jgi:RHH-type rel operon transcriptional repressor/antitoxin RelB